MLLVSHLIITGPGAWEENQDIWHKIAMCISICFSFLFFCLPESGSLYP